MALIILLLFILASATLLSFFGTVVRAFALIISAIFALIAAFAWFEPFADKLIARGTMIHSVHFSAFLLLFAFVFTLLAAIVFALTRSDTNLGFLIERIGRAVCGVILGFILAGAVIAGLVMAPLSGKSPYQRFDPINPNIVKPAKSLLNSDGFATGLFSFASKGSLSGKTSFASIHPNFLNQVFLNRIGENVSLTTSSPAIEVPNKTAVWPAPQNLKDAEGKPLPEKNDTIPMIARIGIKKSASSDAGNFTLSQVRLICADKSKARDSQSAKTTNVYPIGYLMAADRAKLMKLTGSIKLEAADFVTPVKWLDFVFDVPENFVPVIAQFKQNNIAQLPAPVAIDKAPLPEPFIPQSKCTTDSVPVQAVESAAIYGVELATGDKFLDGLTLQVKDVNQWQLSQTEASITPAVFEENRLVIARSELIIQEPNKPADESGSEPQVETPKVVKKSKKPVKKKFARAAVVQKTETPLTFGEMLKPLAGYKLISLKCNNPADSNELRGEQLPVLIELSGLTHYPVGVVAVGTVDSQTVYEVDYCSQPLVADSNVTTGCLVIAETGAVVTPFPENVWLTAKAQTITEFYTLYLVKAGGNTIITAVKASDGTPAKIEKFEGFSLK